MEYFVDLHMHSRFARATSRNLTLPVLEQTALQKGITIIGTGDFTHPLWFAELESQLAPAEQGLFVLKNQPKSPVRFMLSVEISSIFTQNGKGRRVHTLVMLPSLEAARIFNKSLINRRCNLASDGRPIVGLSVKQVARLALDADPYALIVPAHAWTPWFGILGSQSGFDSLEECFEELTPHILAIETGLSSDPAMNWQVSALDNVALVSFSDAHSPIKIAREATQLKGELSYKGIYEAFRTGAPIRAKERSKSPTKLLRTIEFFPEEGKYHYDGHREHKVRQSPAETAKEKGVCRVCGRPVTVGVLSRVEKLSDRARGFKPQSAPEFKSLVPLYEIIAEALGVNVNTKKVASIYEDMIKNLGGELSILLSAPLDKVASIAGPVISEGINRVRLGKLDIEPGYDGEFGTVKIFAENEQKLIAASDQTSLF